MPYDYRSSSAYLNNTSKTLEDRLDLYRAINPATDPTLAEMLKSRGIHNNHEVGDDWFTRFARFGVLDPYNGMKNTREFLFFTKPDLHIGNHNTSSPSRIQVQHALANNPFFVDACQRYPEIVAQLQYSIRTNMPFMAVLSNAVTSPLDLSSLSSDSVDTAANTWGTKITYRGSSLKSDEETEFTLEFLDTKYLEIYMLFKMYDEYEKLKWEGLLLPDPSVNDDIKWIQYTINKVLHDQFAVYKFVVGEDGMSLVYWARITGVYPTGAPRDAFSDMNNSDGQKLSVSFKGFRTRDFDPMILQDFDRIVRSHYSGSIRNYYALWDNDLNGVGGSFAGMPYIVSDTNLSTRNQLSSISVGARMQPYYLMWLP